MTIHTPAQLDSKIAESLYSYPDVPSRRIAKAIVADIDHPADLLIAMVKLIIEQRRRWRAMSQGQRPTNSDALR